MRNAEHKTDLLSQLLPYSPDATTQQCERARMAVHQYAANESEEELFLRMLGLK